MLFIAAILELACCCGVAPLRLTVAIFGREREGVGIVEVHADHNVVSRIVGQHETVFQHEHGT